jgi:excisionase family DNA binding protein
MRKNWYTKAEAAEYLSCTSGELQKIIVSGFLKSYKLFGSRIRIRKMDLEYFINHHGERDDQTIFREWKNLFYNSSVWNRQVWQTGSTSQSIERCKASSSSEIGERIKPRIGSTEAGYTIKKRTRDSYR